MLISFLDLANCLLRIVSGAKLGFASALEAQSYLKAFLLMFRRRTPSSAWVIDRFYIKILQIEIIVLQFSEPFILYSQGVMTLFSGIKWSGEDSFSN